MKIIIATSIKYGNYKHLMAQANGVKKLVKQYWSMFIQEFDFDQNFTLQIRPIRGNTLGRARSNRNIIEIDPRYSKQNIINTIAHELVHLEQYKQKRLMTKGNDRVWNNTFFRTATTYKQYFNRPWEVEARARAEQFVTKYFTSIN